MPQKPLVRKKSPNKKLLVVLVCIILVPFSFILLLAIIPEVFGLASIVMGPIVLFLYALGLIKLFQHYIFRENAPDRLGDRADKNMAQSNRIPSNSFQESKTVSQHNLEVFGLAFAQSVIFSIGTGVLIHASRYGMSPSQTPVILLSMALSFLLFALINTLLVRYVSGKAKNLSLLGLTVFYLLLSLSSINILIDKSASKDLPYLGMCKKDISYDCQIIFVKEKRPMREHELCDNNTKDKNCIITPNIDGDGL